MLSTRIVQQLGHDLDNLFQIVSGDGFIVASFDWPLMETSRLRKMIAGEDAEDHDRETGFHVVVKNGKVSIDVNRVNEAGQVKIDLPLEVCQTAFRHLLTLYENNCDSNYDRDEIHVSSPRTLARVRVAVGLDDSEGMLLDGSGVISGGGDIHIQDQFNEVVPKVEATLVINNNQPWFELVRNGSPHSLWLRVSQLDRISRSHAAADRRNRL